LRNPASIEPKDRKEFSDLRNSELKTARAWALKKTARALYERPEHPQEHAADGAENGAFANGHLALRHITLYGLGVPGCRTWLGIPNGGDAKSVPSAGS